ncbi:MAG TPA: ATP-binding protein [Thermoanaerobaculia bacterium]|nr:ATP-binding protein [Thermoanaerobaculia bacterium]
MISHIPLKDITKSDLDTLAEIKEGRHIEYKQALPSDKSEKRDFLADVSAFANADGGDILFGVHDKRANGQSTGQPDFVGLSGLNVDQEILKLQNSIRDGLEPPLRVEIREVPGFDKGPILVVRVPQSWNSPHMIKSTPSFYVRNNNGNNPLGVQEIREVFLRSETIEKRMREFRDERLGRILSGDVNFGA